MTSTDHSGETKHPRKGLLPAVDSRSAEAQEDMRWERRLREQEQSGRCPTCSASQGDDQDCGGVGPICTDPWHTGHFDSHQSPQDNS